LGGQHLTHIPPSFYLTTVYFLFSFIPLVALLSNQQDSSTTMSTLAPQDLNRRQPATPVLSTLRKTRLPHARAWKAAYEPMHMILNESDPLKQAEITRTWSRSMQEYLITTIITVCAPEQTVKPKEFRIANETNLHPRVTRYQEFCSERHHL
jgi:hypothetical protein